VLVNRLRRLVQSSAPARPLAVVRMVIGLAAVLKALERAPILDRMSDAGVLAVPYVASQPSITAVPSALVVIVWVVLGAAFAAGAFTTLVGVGLTSVMAAVLFSDQQLFSNHLYLLIWLVALLTLARSGAALSVDAHRGRGSPSVPAWPIALLRLQVVVLYGFAALSKLNATYLSGTVVAVSLRRDGPLAVPDAWRSFEVMAVASILSFLFELGLAMGLLLPRWRRTAFVVGLGLHVSIALWLEPTFPLVIFAIMSLGPYLLFLDGRPSHRTVVWDDACTFCAGWIRLFRRLDWLGVLRMVPNSDAHELARLDISREEADAALQLVDGHRRTQGFRAVVRILESLPLTFLWAPLLRLWPIAQIGDAAYRRVASRRSCGITQQAG